VSIRQEDLDVMNDKVDEPLLANSPNSAPCLVVLVHGIRDGARWFRRLELLIKATEKCEVEPVGFGFFNVLLFLAPFFTRSGPVNTVKNKLEHAIAQHPECNGNLIIIAHSFGTFCITKILKECPHIRPKKIIFCGSIIPQGLRWDQVRNLPDIFVNECGARDIWPSLAYTTTYGYGSSGTGGFQHPGIVDRYHDVGHGGYFEDAFVQKYWIPLIHDGTIVASGYEAKMPEAPYWRKLLGIRPVLPWLMWLLLAIFSVLAYTTYSNWDAIDEWVFNFFHPVSIISGEFHVKKDWLGAENVAIADNTTVVFDSNVAQSWDLNLNRLKVGKGVHFELVGHDADQSALPRAALGSSGANPGDAGGPGAPGATGVPGSPSPQLKITVVRLVLGPAFQFSAVAGKGQPGQPGGNGGTGANGNFAHDGANGGHGGDGGNGGAGGDIGDIIVKYHQVLTSDSTHLFPAADLSTTFSGGDGGAGGAAGSGGQGGQGNDGFPKTGGGNGGGNGNAGSPGTTGKGNVVKWERF
jgi:hypothetical protein